MIEKIKSIEFLKNCDLRTIPESILLEKIEIIIDGHLTSMALYHPGNILYRGIKFDHKPELYNDIIYPPKHLATLNRASGENEQMFYCSNLKKAPFYELFVNIGDKLVLSTWTLNKHATFNNIGYSKTNLTNLGSIRDSPFMSTEYKELSNKQSFDLISDYLGELFCKKILPEENYYYKLTNAIAKKHFNARPKDYNNPIKLDSNSLPIDLNKKDFTLNNFPGLTYPTIQNDGIADNFVILKEAIDDNILEFNKVEYIEIVDIINNQYKYKIIDIAFEIKNSKIEWKKLDKQWHLYDDTEEINFVEENGLFLAFTPFGDLIDPI